MTDDPADDVCDRCEENPREPGLKACRACLDRTNARRKPQVNSYRSPVERAFNLCCIAHGFHRQDCPSRR